MKSALYLECDYNEYGTCLHHIWQQLSALCARKLHNHIPLPGFCHLHPFDVDNLLSESSTLVDPHCSKILLHRLILCSFFLTSPPFSCPFFGSCDPPIYFEVKRNLYFYTPVSYNNLFHNSQAWMPALCNHHGSMYFYPWIFPDSLDTRFESFFWTLLQCLK